ncbi:MAG: hypothetical protein HYX92_06875 [Chloroflexi bacterium]|nr:hypothetical protein [Chloroflexota bacterium]
MKIHLRRRTKIVSGIVAVLVLAVLVVGFVTGLPGSGRRLLGSAYIDPENSSLLKLESGWIGASIGRMTVTNPRQNTIRLRGYHWHLWGDYPNYRPMGEEFVPPGGHTRVFDYKGIALIELAEWGGGRYEWYALPWSAVTWSDNPIGGTGIWGPLNLHFDQLYEPVRW